MTQTTTHRAASCARPPAALSGHIVEELHRYDEHLRDVRGLAAGTRKGRLRVVVVLLQEKFRGRAIQIGPQRALARLHEPEAKIQRYRAPDSLINFLKTL